MRTYPTLPHCFHLHFRLIYGCLWALLLGGCDMIEYHPYDLDIDGETDVNRRHIEQIEEATRGKDEIRFAVISDTQRWYDETEDAVEALNRRGDLDFVVHTGDLSDFGLKLEFEKQRDILNGLNVPYVCLLGNHDCLATGLDVYRKIFGTEDFAFTAGNVRFLCLNTNALEFDNSSAVPNIQYIRNEIDNVPEGGKRPWWPCMRAPSPSSSTTTWRSISSITCGRCPTCSSVSTATDTTSVSMIFSTMASCTTNVPAPRSVLTCYSPLMPTAMRMKWSIFKGILVGGLAAITLLPLQAQNDSVAPTVRERRWDQRTHLHYEGWERLKPTHLKWQYAGGMGLNSVGIGWDYGRRCQWETDFLVGFLPSKYAEKFRLTFTVKQNYIPWSICFKEHWMAEPFYCGLYFTTIAGEEFWKKEPGRYPNKYYNFSTKVRPYLFVGQRFGFSPRHELVRHVSLFYELSTCELYLISKVTNKSLSMRDILRLSFGVKVQLFREHR